MTVSDFAEGNKRKTKNKVYIMVRTHAKASMLYRSLSASPILNS